MFLTGYYIPARIHKKKLVLAGCGPPAEKLPSTSPANAAWKLEALADRWKEIRYCTQ